MSIKNKLIFEWEDEIVSAATGFPHTRYSPLNKSARPSGEPDSLIVNNASLHRVFAAANSYLAVLELCVREGSHVEAALGFAEFIERSGLCALMRDNPETNERLAELMPYDGSALFDRAERLRLMCCRYWEGKTSKADGTAVGVPVSEVQKLNAKMDAILRLAELATARRRREAVESQLRRAKRGALARSA